MKNLTWLMQIGALALLLVLAACAPAAEGVDEKVQPTLYAVTAPEEFGGEMLLQGRYFGDGQDGDGDSYVIMGANIYGKNGGRLKPNTWSPNKITLKMPEKSGYGFVFVVVDGVKSNGIPVNTP